MLGVLEPLEPQTWVRLPPPVPVLNLPWGCSGMNSRDIIRSLMSNSHSVIYFKDSEGQFTLVNQKWVNLYGVEPSRIIGRNHFGGYTEEIASSARANERLVESQGREHTFEEGVLQEDGAHHYISTTFPVYDDSNTLLGTGTISTEITEQKHLEQDLKHSQTALQQMVMQDQLTGAYSRKAFYEKLEEEILRHSRYHRPLALLMFDLDHFKQVNIRFGHAVGDQTLKRVVSLVGEVLRDTDFICRIGSEEFAVVAPETHIEGGEELAQRILQALRNEEFYLVQSLTASIGVTEMIEGDDLDQVIRRLDGALDEAKSAGRNCVAVSSI